LAVGAKDPAVVVVPDVDDEGVVDTELGETKVTRVDLTADEVVTVDVVVDGTDEVARDDDDMEAAELVVLLDVIEADTAMSFRLYTFKREPPPQYWSLLPEQVFLQSLALVATEPGFSWLPQ
jgi:hypothetical protein